MGAQDRFEAMFAALQCAGMGLESAVLKAPSGALRARRDTRIVEALMQTLRVLIAKVLGLPATPEVAETLGHVVGACVLHGIAIATLPDDVWHELTADAAALVDAYDAESNMPATVDILTCEDVPQSVRDTIRDILAHDGGEL